MTPNAILGRRLSHRIPNLKNCVDPATEQVVIDFAI